MHTTYSKTSKAKRWTSAALAALMCLSGVNLGLMSTHNNSTDMSAHAAHIEEKLNSTVYDAGQTYYDSGTMWLQGYYSAYDASKVKAGDETPSKTGNKYMYDPAHYHDTDGWLTLDVKSNITSEGAVTLPSTTNINDVDTNNIMSCWREYLGKMGGNTPGSAEALYGINTVDFGTPAAHGQPFSYVAKAITHTEDVDDDGVMEIQIDWKVRAWPKDLGDAPADIATIEIEWTNIETDIAATKTAKGIPSEGYKSDFYNKYAPSWESGNDWYDNWIDVPTTYVNSEWGKSHDGISYYNTGIRHLDFSGLDFDDLSGKIIAGDNIIYPNKVHDASLSSIKTGIQVKIENRTAKYNRDGWKGLPDAAMDPSKISIGLVDWDGTSVKASWKWLSTDVDNDKDYYPDLGGMMATASDYAVKNVIEPGLIKNGKTPTVRVYGYYLTGYSLTSNDVPGDNKPAAYKTVIDINTMNKSTNYLLYGNADVDVNTLDLSKADDQAKFVSLTNGSVYQWNAAIIYDYTYGQQRAGGDISAYREPDLGASISTDLTINVNGEDKKYADTATSSVLTETVHYSLSDEALNKEYRVTVDLYEVKYDGSGAATVDADAKLATKTTEASTITTKTGDIPVTFSSIDSTSLTGKSVVAFATLERKDGDKYTEVASHKEVNDAREQVLFTNVYVETTLTSTSNGTHMIPASTGVALTDTVVASGLASGHQYYVVGELKALDSDNNIVVIETSDATAVQTASHNGQLTFTVPYTLNITSYDVNKYDYYVASAKLYEKVDDTTTNLVFNHDDFKNAAQTVYIPSIETDALDGTTNTQQGIVGPTATVNDTITLTNIIPGTYTITGKVMQGTTELATGSKKVVLEANDIVDDKATVTMSFTIDSSALAGKNIVVYESLYAGDTVDAAHKLANHENPNDKRQTIYEPFIDTVATSSNGTHTDVITNAATINDVVSYSNLIPGQAYTLTGSIVDKDGNPVKDATGEAIVVTKNFTPTAASGTETVQFVYDATVNNYDKVICFEVLSLGSNELVSHKDVSDADQTVTYVTSSFYTSAYTSSESIKTLDPIDKAVINDKVVYSSLVGDTKYKLVAELFDKTANDYIKKDGANVTVEHEFTSTTSGNGSVVVTFENVDVSKLANHDIVILQHLYLNSVLVKEAVDKNDANETVHVINPTVATVLAETETDSKVIPCGESVKLTDTITYTGLINGNAYRFVSKLVDADGNVLKDADGKEITITKDFTGTVNESVIQTADFTINSIDLAGKKIVAYNYLYRVVGSEQYLIAKEESVTNEAQTVTVPSISTKASDATTDLKTIQKSATAQVKDIVTYSGLIPGKKYTLTLTIHNKTDNKLLTDVTGQPITVTQDFTPTEASGKVEVVATIDSTKLEGKTLVCFEKLEYEGKEYAIHADVNDKDQTVYVPSIDTLLTGKDGTTKVVNVSENTQLTDKITYTGLDTTATYTVVGKLIDITDGNTVVATKTQTYKPGEASVDGTFAVDFVVDTMEMNEHKLVAFETVSYTKDNKTVVIMEHADANDADQTISVVTTTIVNTGVEYFANTFALVSVLMLMGCVVITTMLMIKRRKSVK